METEKDSISNEKVSEKRKRTCGGPQVNNMPKKKKLKVDYNQNIINYESE
jgi:hypothetical protein